MKRFLRALGYSLAIMAIVGCARGEKQARQRYTEAVQLLRAVQTSGLSSYSQSYSLYTSARKKVEELLATAPDSAIAKQLLAGAAKIDTVPLAEFLAMELRLRRQAQAEKEPLALAFLAATRIEDTFYQGQTLVAIAEQCARVGQLQLAREVVAASADANTKARALIAIGQGLPKNWSSATSAAILAEALAIAKTIEELGSKAETLHLLAAACGQAGLFEQALAVAEGIADPGFKSQALTRIATGLAESGQSAAAVRTLVEARGIVKTIENPRYGAKALVKIAIAYGAIGHLDQGVALAEAIPFAEPKVEAFLALAAILSGRGEEQKAAALVTKALAVGNTLREPAGKGAALHNIAAGYGQSHSFEQALTVAALIESEPGKAAALSRIAECYAQSGQYDLALALAKSIDRDYWQVQGLLGVAAAYGQAGQQDKATQLLAAVLAVAKTIADPAARVEAYSRIAAGYGEAGQTEKATAVLATALESIEEIEERLAQATALTRIAAAAPQATDEVDPPTLKIRQAIIRRLGKERG